MLDLYVEGGPLFMGILTIIFIIAVVIAVRAFTRLKNGKISAQTARRNYSYVRSLGLLAFVFGIFGQLVGLYDAFVVIEEVGNISPSMLAGGLKVSIHTTVYGTFILMICMLIQMILDSRIPEADN